MRMLMLCLGLIVFNLTPVYAQNTTTLNLDSNLPEGLVFLDSVYVGQAEQKVFEIPTGPHRLVLVPPEADSWAIRKPTEEILALPGDTLSVTLNVPYTYRIETVPYGASVLVDTDDGRVTLGRTPLLYTRDAPFEGPLYIEKPDYETEILTPGTSSFNRYSMVLQPVELVQAEMPDGFDWQPAQTQRFTWVDYTVAGLALASGAVSVYYKFKGDELFREYEATGDPELRPDIERNDRYAAYALGSMQIGLGFVAFRLVLR